MTLDYRHVERRCPSKAAIDGNIEVMTCLANAGADLNKAYRDGTTPLHIFAKSEKAKEKFNVIACLIQNGANCYILDNEGNSCFDVASQDVRRQIFMRPELATLKVLQTNHYVLWFSIIQEEGHEETELQPVSVQTICRKGQTWKCCIAGSRKRVRS